MSHLSLGKNERLRAESGVYSSSEDDETGRDTLGYIKVVENLRKCIEFLQTEENVYSPHYRKTLKFVQRHTSYEPDVIIGQELVKKIVTFKISNVLVRILRSTENVDIFEEENAIAYKNLRDILSCIWNCTHKSPQLCEELISNTATLTLCEKLQFLVTNMVVYLVETSSTQDRNFDAQKCYKSRYLCKAYLSILHNVARQNTREGNFINVRSLQPFLQLDIPKLIKAKVCILLAYLPVKGETDALVLSSDITLVLLDILRRAIKMENFFDQETCYEAYEIVAAINRLAINDVNKELLGEAGAIEIYLCMLSEGGIENQRVAASGLWVLAFSRQNRIRMRGNKLCLRMLNNLAVNGADESIRRAARAAEFVLRFESPEPGRRAFCENVPHVMLSYNHSTQPVMLKLYKFLQRKGYNVWMDVDHMRGSTLDAMALAVERCDVMIVGVCQRYQDSASCRTEGDYAYQLKKSIIPVNLERNFTPSGWLGCLLGTRLSYDLWDENRLEQQMERVAFDLGDRCRLPDVPQTNLLNVTPMRQPNPTSAGSAAVAAHLGVPRDDTPEIFKNWTTEQTVEWLRRNNIPARGFLLELDGKLLLQLRKMYLATPETFYRVLRSDLDYDVIAALRLANMLDSMTP